MHVVRFRIQDSRFKILTEHEDTKARRRKVRSKIQDSGFKIKKHKNKQKPVENHFSVKHPCFARLCQKQSIVILQASLRLPMYSFQQPWRA